MGIVKISDLMHVGMLTELHPELNHREICQLLIRAELAREGLDITAADTAPAGKH